MMNLPLAVVTILGGREHDLGIIFAIGPIVEIPLMMWFGHLAARGHQLSLIRFGVLATVGYFLVLSFATQPWHTYPAQVLSGISFAILTNITISFFQDLLPGQRGLATTIFSNALNSGNLLGYFFFGTLLEARGHRGVFLMCGGISVAALVLILLYRHRAVRPTEPLAGVTH
jgi:SET family sugar efflux transporter-like MFS transporter